MACGSCNYRNMSFIHNNNGVPGALFGAGLGMIFGGPDLISLGGGAAVGYFVYPYAQSAAQNAMPSFSQRKYVLPAVIGGFIGYEFYFGDIMYAGAGAAAGAALEYVINKY